MKKLILIVIVFVIAINAYSQEFSRTNGDFSIKDSDNKLLRFDKGSQSNIFTEFNYQDLNYGIKKVRELKEEIKVIEFLWNAAKDSITIDLKSVHVGYPLRYKDILEKQIEVFSNSPKWQKYTVYRKNNDVPSWKIDHELIESIMFEGKIYNVLDDLLNKFGYKIKGFSVEKIGYVTQKDIDKFKLKYDENIYKDIPIPFMVWTTVEKIQK